MQHYLASGPDAVRTAWVKRFQPRFWTVDFPRPMMAAASNPQVGVLRVDLVFLTGGDLAGLIWESADRWSHPLLARGTDRDYRGCRLVFDWVSSAAVMPLDSVFGPVLTIEGRDADGVATTWYVRLWNYAAGAGDAARITLDFDALRAGFGPGGAEVFCGDIDRMFVSLVPVAFAASGAPLPAPLEGFVVLGAMQCTGPRSTIALGDAFLPEHRLRICSGYDDSYNQVPERLVEQWQALGYRDLVNHYVGMSHYYALSHVGDDRFEVTDGLCQPAVAWHRALLRAAGAVGMDVILSLSMELFDANAPAAWAQRDAAGDRALTGWAPPSTLLSPCSVAAMTWLQGIARAFVDLADDEGARLLFQVGEPWWWVGPEGRPCFYDPDTVARWTQERGGAPPVMLDVDGIRTPAEQDFLDWLGALLVEATDGLVAAARADRANMVTSHLLFYAPQVLDSAKPDLARANMPAGWAAPAFDVLQLEDYSFVTAGDESGMVRGRAAVDLKLGYPLEQQHYLSGFVLDAGDAGAAWPKIAAAATDAMARGVPQVMVWAWPQVARDGFVMFDIGHGGHLAGDGEMEAFHDVLFPTALGFGAVGGPSFQTQIVETASGFEQRNMLWESGRLRYDAGLGVRSEADLRALLAFFRARRGQAHGFRFRDPLDHGSRLDGGAPTALDQQIGVGDGMRLSFPLVKRYGEAAEGEVRRITRPVAASVLVAVDGVVQPGGWTLLAGGVVQFDVPPAMGAEVRAGFLFDVPVRFSEDRLDVSLSGWNSGESLSVPLLEIRE